MARPRFESGPSEYRITAYSTMTFCRSGGYRSNANEEEERNFTVQPCTGYLSRFSHFLFREFKVLTHL
jgi:hypothetical protein